MKISFRHKTSTFVRYMKRYLFLLFFISLISGMATAQSIERCDTDCARLTFASDTINYGRIARNSDNYRELHYKNTGKCPVAIWSVNGLFTRQAVLTKKYLQAGDSGTLKLYYPTDGAGNFTKIFTICSSAQPIKSFYIFGNILPDQTCADMKTASDMMDLGPLHYVYGKHFTIKIGSTGKCPLVFHATPVDDYMNMISYTEAPVNPGDSGNIDIHIGGQLTGHYYGYLHVYSSNAFTAHKAILIKATFMPPDSGDASDTKIEVDTDMIYIGNTYNKAVTAKYTIKNMGKKPLILTATNQSPDIIKSGTVNVIFDVSNTSDAFIKHISISGNFIGKSMPLYIMGFTKTN
jgi:hypothetical protein